jgi:regulator of protease activity HflC (stomatin/prohibitin superfamily)
MLFKRINIAQNERGLYFENSNLTRIIEPGKYLFTDFFNRIKVEVFNLNEPEFIHELEDLMLKQQLDLCAQYFQVTSLNEFQVGLVYRNGILNDILAPSSRQFYWLGHIDIRVEVIDVKTNYQLAEDKALLLTRVRDVALAAKLTKYIYIAEVSGDHTGLLIVDGQLVRELQSGVYVFWRFNRSIKVELVDTRVQMMEVSGQEILTRDKVSLRINLSVAFQLIDAVKVRTAFKDLFDYLYREMQFGLRQIVAGNTLDDLLAEKGAAEREVYQYILTKVKDCGIKLITVGIKDIILPGEMKLILNKLVEAEKIGQANVLKRREETAATRSLLNTAKLMDENPTLLRLKELETLEKVTEKVDRLTVFGGLEGVLKDTIKINV